MRKYISSMYIFYRLNFRSPFYIISILLGAFYLGVMIYTYSASDITNPGNLLQLSSFLIQGYMLIFMLLGYRSVKQETAWNSNEIFMTIPKGFVIKIVSNLVFLVLSNIIFCVTSLFLFILVFHFSGYGLSSFHLKVSYFILVYWFIPAFISTLVGAMIGAFSRGKMGYFSILVMWLLLSPMNVYVIQPLFQFLGFPHIPGYFHLGVPDPEMSYNSFSGFIFTKEDLVNKVLWMAILVLCILAGFILRNPIILNKQKSLRISVLLILLSFLVSSFSSVSKSNPLIYHQRNLKELDYYAETFQKKHITGLDYVIEEYDINLTIEERLNASVILKFDDKIQGEKIFSLYHGFKIDSIKDNNGHRIEFAQDGDFIEVDVQMATRTLTMVYSGESSPFMDANSSFAYLPFYFAWIPLKSAYPSMRYVFNSNHRLPSQPSIATRYHLQFHSTKEIVTNLKNTGQGKYEGTSADGLTLIYGELSQKRIEGYDIIYPLTWENSINNVKSYTETLEKTLQTTKEIFGLDGLTRPKKLLFIPARGPNDTLPSETMWYVEGEYLIILIDSYEHHDEEVFEHKKSEIPYQMLGSLLWKKDKTVHEDESIPIVFNVLVGTYINERMNGEIKQFNEEDYWIGEVILKETKENKIVIQNLISYIGGNSFVEIDNFLTEWYSLISNPNVTWKDIDELLKEKRSGQIDKSE